MKIGYPCVPQRYLIPITTAVEMYKWTGRQIFKGPFIVYRVKVKSRKKKIIKTALITTHSLLLNNNEQKKVECKI